MFGVLILPQGIYLGLVTLVLPLLLSKTGVPVDRIAHFTSLLSVPWICFFLWAPLVDMQLRRSTWLISAAFCAAFSVVVAISFSPAVHIQIVMLFALFGAVAASLVMAACGGLMLTTLTAPEQGRASGWCEAGKLAGSALGAGAILWFSLHLSTVVASLLSGLMVALPALAALAINEPTAPIGFPFKRRLLEIGRELRSLFASPRRSCNLVILASPLGVGAAIGLLPAIASSYGVGENGVILTNGIAGGVILAIGALCGVLLPKDWDRRRSYAVSGFANVCATMILLLGRRSLIYFLGDILYLGTTGLCWGRYAALVAETAGAAEGAVSTRYSLVAAAGNVPLAYMLWIEGVGYKLFGIKGLLWMDAGGNLIGLAIALFIRFLCRP